MLSSTRPGEDRQLSVLIATVETISDDQQLQLEQLGCEVRTVAGDVITASLPANSLASMGELDFVRYVELARPLHLEPDQGETQSE